jgi:hypothetical protein
MSWGWRDLVVFPFLVLLFGTAMIANVSGGTANHKTQVRCRIKLHGNEAENVISTLWTAKKSEVAERNHGSKFRSASTNRPA